MDLEIKDVAQLLNVTEGTIVRWLQDGKIPAYRLNKKYRFNRQEIEDWVLAQKLGKASEAVAFDDRIEAYHTKKEAAVQPFALYRAIHHGGVVNDALYSSKEEAIRLTCEQIAEKFQLDAEILCELLLDREKLMSTAIGSGIAVPHARDFLLPKHQDIVTIVFLKEPLNWGALDGKPVKALFFLLATDDKQHLNLLSKIAHLAMNEGMSEQLLNNPNKQELLLSIKTWEEALQSRLS